MGMLKRKAASQTFPEGEEAQVGKYTLDGTLLGEGGGEGGFTVFQAKDASGTVHAMKKFESKAGKSYDKQRFENEKKCHELLQAGHPNVVKYVGSEMDKKVGCIVMEACGGGDLLAVMQATPKGAKRHESAVKKVVKQILEGLQFIHSQGIVHLDVRPANLLLTDDGSVKIADFSHSLVLDKKKGLVPASQMSASTMSKYAGPEACGKKAYNGKAADMWSVGVVVWVLMTASLPFKDTKEIKSASYTMNAVFSEELKAFLQKIFKVKTEERLTVEQALQDPWILGTKIPVDDTAKQELVGKLQEQLDAMKADAEAKRQKQQEKQIVETQVPEPEPEPEPPQPTDEAAVVSESLEKAQQGVDLAQPISNQFTLAPSSQLPISQQLYVPPVGGFVVSAEATLPPVDVNDFSTLMEGAKSAADPCRLDDTGGLGPEDLQTVNASVMELVASCKKEGKLYRDPQFPPGPKALYMDPDKHPAEAVVAGWRRPHEWVEEDPLRLLPVDCQKEQVQLGGLADEGLLQALQHILLERGHLLRKLFYFPHFREYGVVCVAFWSAQAQQWVPVVTDDLLPCNEEGLPAYTTSTTPNVIWCSLLEKAYAKFKGSYQALAQLTVAEALLEITGGNTGDPIPEGAGGLTSEAGAPVAS